MTADFAEFLKAGAEILTLVRDTPENARDYFRKHNIPFKCLADVTGEVYHRYEVKSKLLSLGQRPALFVLDREGVVRYAYLGSQQWEIPGNKEVLEVVRSVC